MNATPIGTNVAPAGIANVGMRIPAMEPPRRFSGPAIRPTQYELPSPTLPSNTVVGGGTKRIVLNFQNAPWDMVLKQLSGDLGLPLWLDTLPEGTFSYVDSQPRTLTEVIDILNSSLTSAGYLLVRKPGTLTLLRFQDSVALSELPLVPLHELSQWGNNELISVEVPLTSIDPVVAAQEVQPLLSSMGRAVPLPQSHRLIVSDWAGNLRRLYELLWIGQIDPHRMPHVVFHLKNIQAVDAAKVLNEFLSAQKQSFGPPGLPGPPGDMGQPPMPMMLNESCVVAEATTNCLIVSATNRHLERIQMLLQELDAIPVQVVIQALLVEVDLGNTQELGVEFGGQDSVLFDRSVVDKLVTVTETVSDPATGIATTNQRIISSTAAPGFNFNNQPLGNNTAGNPSTVGTQGLSNLAVGRVNGDLGYGGLVVSAGSNSVNVLLRALSATRKVDILSRPQIRTVDNRPAEIQIGQQVPVVDGVALTPVGSANPIIRQDQAGIILKVTPRVNAHGEVVIDVLAEKSEFRIGKGSGVPIFTDATNGNVIEAPIKDLSKARATVSCPNGQTIVLGGMITKGTSVMERKVPLLGDIPLLGRLFRYDSEQMGRKELLIFLTPQVVACAEDSEKHKAVEISRSHFPMQDAMQIHSPTPGPPEAIQPPGPRIPQLPQREPRPASQPSEAGRFNN